MSNFDFIDLHCDTLMSLYLRHNSLKDNPGHINLDKLVEGNSFVQCFAIFTPTHMPQGMSFEDPYPYFVHMTETFYREMEKNKDVIRPVRCVDDILKNRQEGYLSAMLTVEDGVAIDGKMEILEEMYDKGVRMIALTWNHENSLGYPNSKEEELHQLGLKPFGIEAVRRMNELGMIIDVSHLSEGGFWDIVKHSEKPFIASHSCARALCSHQRNLTDAQLEALGNKGGICGVNFNAPFLVDDAEYTYIADIVRHARHIADKAGIEAVALGSDFDGIGCGLECVDYTGMNAIKEALVAEFGSFDTEKITHGNALRLFKEVIG